jgi:hypothetical protein
VIDPLDIKPLVAKRQRDSLDVGGEGDAVDPDH